MKWQSIDTAPKYGQILLGWWQKTQSISFVYWQEGCGWMKLENGTVIDPPPTDWLLVPKPPKARELPDL